MDRRQQRDESPPKGVLRRRAKSTPRLAEDYKSSPRGQATPDSPSPALLYTHPTPGFERETPSQRRSVRPQLSIAELHMSRQRTAPRTTPLSSASSMASSLFDKVTGGTSARTSVDTETRPMRELPARYRNGGDENIDIEPPEKSSTWWSPLANAATYVSETVTKVWNGDPAAKESKQLAEAMKTYHLDNARSANELPNWLFQPHERQPLKPLPPVRGRASFDGERQQSFRRTSYDRPRGERRESVMSEEPKIPEPKGLKDVYAAASANAPQRSFNSNRNRGEETIAAARLREFRNAKRGGLVGGMPEADEEALSAPPRRELSMRRTQRSGLPSGPRQIRV